MVEIDKKTVLVIDDDEHLRDLIVMCFSETFKTLDAENGEDGLVLAFRHKPDIVVLDLMLPGKSGEEVLVELQKNEGTRDIPVIVVSAFNFEDGSAARIEGAPNVKALLRKPFTLEKLLGLANLALAPR